MPDLALTGRDRGGRPPHRPTAKTRSQVDLLASLGWSCKRIAAAICIDQATLRRHYELNRNAARDRVDGMLMAKLLDLFLSTDNVAAARELRVRFESADRLAGRLAPTEKPLGKKEAALRAALEPDPTSEWGRLLIERKARYRAEAKGEPN